VCLIYVDEQTRLLEYSLQSLYKRPPPVWVHPTFLGMFGDAYVEGIGLAGGDISTTLACFSLVLERTVNEQMFLLEKLSHVELQALHYLTQILRNGKDLSRKVSLFALISFDVTIFCSLLWLRKMLLRWFILSENLT
jgi:hypothetical protein